MVNISQNWTESSASLLNSSESSGRVRGRGEKHEIYVAFDSYVFTARNEVRGKVIFS